MMFAAEAALVWNSFSLQGEYAVVEADKRCFTVAPGAVDPCSQGADSGDVEAFYVYGSWFPTGETRRYEGNRGEFNRTRILNPVTAGGMGAFEVGVRYDNVDLSGIETVRRFTGPGGPVDVRGPVDRGGEYEAGHPGRELVPLQLRSLHGQLHFGRDRQPADRQPAHPRRRAQSRRGRGHPAVPRPVRLLGSVPASMSPNCRRTVTITARGSATPPHRLRPET